MLLEHYRVCDEDIDDVELLLGEMCSNVIRHAYVCQGGRYTVDLALEGKVLRVTVTDSGRGFSSDQLPDEPAFSEAGGMGLFLMSQFADRVDFRVGDGGGSRVSVERAVRLEAVHS
jgi:serine/threonine-protein kinase RsbW